MFVHQEENCAQCVTWSSSSGSQEKCAAIFHTGMAESYPYDRLSDLTEESLQAFLADDVK